MYVFTFTTFQSKQHQQWPIKLVTLTRARNLFLLDTLSWCCYTKVLTVNTFHTALCVCNRHNKSHVRLSKHFDTFFKAACLTVRNRPEVETDINSTNVSVCVHWLLLYQRCVQVQREKIYLCSLHLLFSSPWYQVSFFLKTSIVWKFKFVSWFSVGRWTLLTLILVFLLTNTFIFHL